MKQKIQAIRGMNDILPSMTPAWQGMLAAFAKQFDRFHYSQVILPVLEPTQLFTHGVGNVTDIVEKEMYSFEDRNGDWLSLRPEGTAGCVRAGIENGLFYNQQQKWWYYGPMYRHERPQKGRYRQFYQLGIEVFGFDGPEVDVELIQLTYQLWQQFGIIDQCWLEINSLGSSECRAAYRDVLVEYFEKHKDQLDEDSLRRLHKNPLRILDSKNTAMAELISHAPKITDHLDEASKQHFARYCYLLDALDIPYKINPNLVRGLDYYTHVVFEWKTDALGSQGTLAAGGRYDGLVERLGGKPTPATGLAVGIERVLLLVEAQEKLEEIKHDNRVDVFGIVLSDTPEAMALMMSLAHELRLNDLNVQLNLAGGSPKSQFKKADKSDARWAIILGDEELANKQFTLKTLRADDSIDGSNQLSVAFDDIAALLKKHR